MLEGELERLALDPGLGAERGGLLTSTRGRVGWPPMRAWYSPVLVEAGAAHRAAAGPPLGEVGDVLVTGVTRGRPGSGLGLAEVEGGQLPVQPPADQRLGGFDQLPEGGPAVLADVLGWVEAGRHGQHVRGQRRLGGGDQLGHAPPGRPPAGGVGVEGEHDPPVKRPSSLKCSVRRAVPQVATAWGTPAWWQAITSV